MSELDDALRALLRPHIIEGPVFCCGRWRDRPSDHIADLILKSEWLRARELVAANWRRPDTTPPDDPNLPEPTMSGPSSDYESGAEQDRHVRDVERGLR